MDEKKKTRNVKESAQTVPVMRKEISFEQWAVRKGVKTHHRGGLRAFVINPDVSRTVEEWDACFVAY